MIIAFLKFGNKGGVVDRKRLFYLPPVILNSPPDFLFRL